MWSTSLFWAHCSSRNDKGPLRPAIPVAVMASLAQGCILQILCWLSGEQSFRDSPLDSPWEHFWRELMPPSQVLEHVDHSVQFFDELAWKNYEKKGWFFSLKKRSCFLSQISVEIFLYYIDNSKCTLLYEIHNTCSLSIHYND